MNLVPIGTNILDENDDTDVTKDAFSKILRNNGYNENQIKAAVKRHYE